MNARLRITQEATAPREGSAAAQVERALNLGHRRGGWWSLAEILIFVGGFLALSCWLHPVDPFWTGAGFPWLWLVVSLIALRYGALTGTAAVGVALLAWFLVMPDTGAAVFPRSHFLGGLVLVLVAGEFSDVWNVRLQRERTVNAYLDERLHALTHNHYLLRLSHERLEQELIARPQTLRESLAALRQPMAEDLQRGLPLPGAQALLQLLAQSCRLESAGLHRIERGRLLAEPVASAGTPQAAERGDPLVREALRSGLLLHVQAEDLGREADASRYLVCAPVVSSAGRQVAALVVRRMAFAALSNETLQFLAVLLAYYADGIDETQVARGVLARYPDCPGEFAFELTRLRRVVAISGVQSALVAFVFQRGPTPPEEWHARITRLCRSVDVAWSIRGRTAPTLLMLLPLTGAAGISGYLERLGSVIRDQYGADFAQAGIAVHQATLDARPAEAQLAAFLERLHG
jgi:hypothetical protein